MPSRVPNDFSPRAIRTTAAPFTNSSMRPTFRLPIRPGPNTTKDSRIEAASTPMTPAMTKPATVRRGDSAGLGSWSRYQTTAVTGIRKLPSSTMVGSRITFEVRNATPTDAAHRARPISSTAHHRGAQICPFDSPSIRPPPSLCGMDPSRPRRAAPIVPAPSTATRDRGCWVLPAIIVHLLPSDRLRRGTADRHLIADDPVDLTQGRSVELQVSGRDRILDVPGAAGADDGDVDGRIGEGPGDRQAADRCTQLELSEPLQRGDHPQVAPIELASEEVALGAPVVRREAGVGAQPTAEQPMGERSVDQDADVVCLRVGQDLSLD